MTGARKIVCPMSTSDLRWGEIERILDGAFGEGRHEICRCDEVIHITVIGPDFSLLYRVIVKISFLG